MNAHPLDNNLFIQVCRLAKALGKTPLQHRLFIHRIDPEWVVVVNGCSIDKAYRDYKIPPGFCFVEYKDAPAGMFTPYGGQFLIDEEEPFLKVLNDAIKRATPPEEEPFGPSSPDLPTMAPQKGVQHDL